MKTHTKLYMDFFGFDIGDFISCEICGRVAIDIHHINSRGMGGTSEPDKIENLMAVCRECHLEYGDKEKYINFLNEIHANYIKGLTEN
jgi:hypothetical protein